MRRPSSWTAPRRRSPTAAATTSSAGSSPDQHGRGQLHDPERRERDHGVKRTSPMPARSPSAPTARSRSAGRTTTSRPAAPRPSSTSTSSLVVAASNRSTSTAARSRASARSLATCLMPAARSCRALRVRPGTLTVTGTYTDPFEGRSTSRSAPELGVSACSTWAARPRSAAPSFDVSLINGFHPSNGESSMS